MNHRFVKITKAKEKNFIISPNDIYFDIKNTTLLHDGLITKIFDRDAIYLTELAKNIGNRTNSKEIEYLLLGHNTPTDITYQKTADADSLIKEKFPFLKSFIDSTGRGRPAAGVTPFRRLYGYPIPIEYEKEVEELFNKFLENQYDTSNKNHNEEIIMKSFDELDLTSLEIAQQLVQNDLKLYQEFGISEGDDLEANPEHWAKFLNENKETFSYLTKGNKIIGNYSFVAFSPRQRQKIKQIREGTLSHASLSIENTVSLRQKGTYILYILNFSVNVEYDSPKNVNMLLDHFFMQLESYAKEGIYFEKIYTHLLRPKHKSYFKGLGFNEISNSIYVGSIYELNSFPKDLIYKKKTNLTKLYKIAKEEGEFKSSRYSIITGKQLNDDYVKMTVDLDKLIYTKDYQISYDKALSWYHKNHDIYIIIYDNELNQIVAYMNACPFKDKTFENIKSGITKEINITENDILDYDIPGLYNLYIFAMAVRPGHEDRSKMITMLQDNFIKKLYNLAKDGFYISNIAAEAVNDTEERLFSRYFRMKEILKTEYNSSIYEIKDLPRNIKKHFTSKREILNKLHKEYIEFHNDNWHLFD